MMLVHLFTFDNSVGWKKTKKKKQSCWFNSDCYDQSNRCTASSVSRRFCTRSLIVNVYPADSYCFSVAPPHSMDPPLLEVNVRFCALWRHHFLCCFCGHFEVFYWPRCHHVTPFLSKKSHSIFYCRIFYLKCLMIVGMNLFVTLFFTPLSDSAWCRHSSVVVGGVCLHLAPPSLCSVVVWFSYCGLFYFYFLFFYNLHQKQKSAFLRLKLVLAQKCFYARQIMTSALF